MTKFFLELLVALLSSLQAVHAADQTSDTIFWEEIYRLDYSYDLEATNGPNAWAQVDTVTDEGEWGWYDNGHPIFDLNIGVNQCGQDVRPSPVNLFQDSLCTDTHEIRTRQSQDGDCTRDNVSFELTPYGLKAYYPWYENQPCLRPTIQMDGFEDFILVWLELHVRSEHVVDGRRYDAELQFVHMGTGANNSEMAVVSVLIDSSAKNDHEEFQWMLNQWATEVDLQDSRCASASATGGRLRKRVLQPITQSRSSTVYNATATSTTQEAPSRRVQQDCKPDKFGQGCEPLAPRKRMYPYSMWPSIWYYSYQGSITQPPCSAIVHWRILDEPMLISRRQYKQLASLLTAYKTLACEDGMSFTSPKGENFRPLQQINSANQPVSHCQITDFSFDVFEEGLV
jgi:carbonic anhydrase